MRLWVTFLSDIRHNIYIVYCIVLYCIIIDEEHKIHKHVYAAISHANYKLG